MRQIRLTHSSHRFAQTNTLKLTGDDRRYPLGHRILGTLPFIIFDLGYKNKFDLKDLISLT